MDVVYRLQQIDREILFLINKKFAISALDNFMLLLRQPYTWIPVYLFFLLFFYANRRKYFLPIIALSIVTFALSDFTSASILKPFFARLRPCYDPTLPFEINNIAGCGGIFSMPSSHASNHFGLAVFWYLIINKTLHQKWYWLLLWASLIGYSQIYVGVHFPGDILGGALLGTLIANFTYRLFNNWMTRINSDPIQNAI